MSKVPAGFFEVLQYATFWITVAVFVAVITYVPKVVARIKTSRRKTLGNHMIKAAESFRRRFVMNIDHDIIAVCTSAAFTKGLHEHNQKVKTGEAKEWEKVVVCAIPTFTFAGSEQTRRPIHTGVREQLELIVRPMILTLTGFDPNEVSNKDFEKALSIIFERDSRLFVPFAGSPAEGEKQFTLYGKTTIEQAINDINRTVDL